MFRQGKQAVKKPAQQNVVIIYADDLGFGDLGCYGSRKIDTPNLDRLCAEGLKFTNAYSTSAVCTPARFSILTGRYPFRNDQAHILPGDAGCIIKRELDTVPKLFQRAGYHTGIVGKWHLGLGDGSKPIVYFSGNGRPCALCILRGTLGGKSGSKRSDRGFLRSRISL